MPKKRGEKCRVFDTLNAGREYRCLIAFANAVHSNIYSFCGSSKVQPNIKLEIVDGEHFMVVTTRAIACNDEFLFDGEDCTFKVPVTVDEETESRLFPKNSVYNYEPRVSCPQKLLDVFRVPLSPLDKFSMLSMIHDAQTKVLGKGGSSILFEGTICNINFPIVQFLLICSLFKIAFNHEYTASDVSKHFVSNSSFPNLLGNNYKNEWLGDATINGMFELYSRIDSKMHRIDRNHGKSLFLSSFNTDKIFESINYRNLEPIHTFMDKRCSKDSMDHIFQYSRLFLPLNIPGHWVMIVIFMVEKSIVYYDSFNGNPKESVSNPKCLLLWLENEAFRCGYGFDRTEWRFSIADCVSQVMKKLNILLFTING